MPRLGISTASLTRCVAGGCAAETPPLASWLVAQGFSSVCPCSGFSFRGFWPPLCFPSDLFRASSGPGCRRSFLPRT
eukprot:5461004-Heterocapsa_arctica.AAC.1